MGNLLQVLRGDGKGPSVEVFLDFENAQPKGDEEAVYAEVNQILQHHSQILESLRGYAGCSESIRAAISTPSQQTEEAAWAAVCPQVERLKSFYDYSNQIAEQCLPKLLGALCEGSPIANLEQKQALAKQLADIFHFVLTFDDAKMKNANIQNDFSFYRRSLNRMKLSNSTMENLVVREELANRMSLFYATPTPMLNALSAATTKFVNDNRKTVSVDNVTECLSTMALICQTMVENPEYVNRFHSKDTVLFCLRVMVGALILYDHVHPVGAFSKRSPIDIKSAIKILKSQSPSDTEGLLNALRYTTRHYNDEDTPKQVKAMLE